MKFQKLNDIIPYATGGKQKVLTMEPYPDIHLALPGRHAQDTTPVGGDFTVCVSDDNVGWKRHQFTHTDLFKDLQYKTDNELDPAHGLMAMYFEVIKGEDPDIMIVPGGDRMPGIYYKTFVRAVQCLAVAEHRRYAQHEEKFGGRYLPFRFGAGITEGLWRDVDAAEKARYGRQGAQQLEREYGLPPLTKKLMS